MFAFVTTWVMFLTFGVIGFATLSLMRSRISERMKILVSPSIGLCLIILPVFWGSLMGWPVKDIAIPIFITAMTSALLVLFWVRPPVAWRQLGLYLLISLLGLLLIGWPMFLYHFDWLGIGNDDMANYVLASARFYDFGFFTKPDTLGMTKGFDKSHFYYFLHVANNIRPGSELLLAFLWRVTSVNAAQLFMPTICMLHLCLLFSVGALIQLYPRFRRLSWVAMVIFILNPLSAWGVGQQLIAQVAGLAILLSLTAVLMNRFSFPSKIFKLKHRFSDLVPYVPIAILAAGQMVIYPEIILFLGATWGLCLIMLFFKNSIAGRQRLLQALLIGCLALVFLGPKISDMVEFMVNQIGLTDSNRFITDNLLFPFFLIPSGLASLWGFAPVYVDISSFEPWLHIGIVLGILLSMLMIWRLFQSLRGPIDVVATMTLVFILAAVHFFTVSDFVIYKLAMYIQPVLVIQLTFLAIDWWRGQSFGMQKFRSVLFVLILIGLGMNIYSLFSYSSLSTGDSTVGTVELRHGSRGKLLSNLRSFFEPENLSPAQTYVTSVENVFLAKIVSFFARSYAVIFPSNNFFPFAFEGENVASPDLLYQKKTFQAHNIKNDFYVPPINPVAIQNPSNLLTIPGQSIFSLQNAPDVGGKDSMTMSNAPKKNQLIFIHSKLGPHYYSGDRRRASFFQLEPDVILQSMTHDQTLRGKDPVFSGVGRYLLFRVENFVPGSRLLMDMTVTPIKSGDGLLPRAWILGEKNVQMNPLGGGAGRFVSEPVFPKRIDGHDYILVDMNKAPESLDPARVGLMRLYGLHVVLDIRNIVGFGRQLRLLSPEEYTAMAPPTGVLSFPQDLMRPGLLFSGFYEDGWVSKDSEMRLFPKSSDDDFEIVGMVPGVGSPNFTTQLEIFADKKRVYTETLKPGPFHIRVSAKEFSHAKSSQQPVRIRLAFSEIQMLPSYSLLAQDGRRVGAHITQIGFLQPNQKQPVSP